MKSNKKVTLIIGGSGYIGTVVNNFFQKKKLNKI